MTRSSLLSRLTAAARSLRRDGIRMRVLAAILFAGLGGAICVGALEFAAVVSQRPFWQLPFITSIALIMGAPSSESARPGALMGGHLASAIAGYIVLWIFGSSEWAAAVSVGLAIIAMLRLKVFHPPAAVNAFLVVKQNLGIEFLFTVVIVGALLLVAFAVAWHRLSDMVMARIFRPAAVERQPRLHEE
jgi:CBS-domain-containing membrane protein